MDEQMTCQLCNLETCTCERRIHGHLTEILKNYDLASKALQPRQGSYRSSNEPSLGIRLAALDFITGHDVLPMLEAWERDWRTFFNLTPFGEASHKHAVKAAISHAKTQNHLEAWSPTRNRYNASTGFLAAWLTRALTEHPAIADFQHEIKNAVNQTRTAAGITQPNIWTVTCPATQDNNDCGWKLHITAEDFYNSITCRKCKTNWTIERLLRVAAADTKAEIWLTPQDAAQLFGIHTSTLRRWAARGFIKRKHSQYEHHSIRNAISKGTQ